MIRPYGALLTGDNLRQLCTRKNEIVLVITELHWEQQAQAFIGGHWPKGVESSHPAAMHLASLRWFEALAEQGWSVPHWPSSAGGLNWSKQRLYQWQMLCQQAQTPPIDTLAMTTIAPLLMTHATPEQQANLLTEIADFQSHWCLGLLEPVDTAARQPTQLIESEGGFRLTGSKRALADGLLSSTELPRDALWPNRILCLALHKGQWAACLLPTARQGLSLRPVANARGRWFHVVFDDVVVTQQDMLGLRGDALLAALATPAAEQGTMLPHASSYGLEVQLRLLRADLEANPHDDFEALLTELNAAEVALRGLQALESRALAPVSPQLPQPLPMSVLHVKSQDLAQKIGALQLASFGYYALPKSDGLLDHNEGPVGPRGSSSTDTALLASQALNALAVSAYGWDPRDILARERLGLGSSSDHPVDDQTKGTDES